MQLDSHGNIVQDTSIPAGFVLNKQTGLLNHFHEVRRTGAFKFTKSQRKETRKDAKAYFPLGHKRQGELKPNAKADLLAKGYTKIMAVLGRGWDVQAA